MYSFAGIYSETYYYHCLKGFDCLKSSHCPNLKLWTVMWSEGDAGWFRPLKYRSTFSPIDLRRHFYSHACYASQLLGFWQPLAIQDSLLWPACFVTAFYWPFRTQRRGLSASLSFPATPLFQVDANVTKLAQVCLYSSP